MDENNHEGYEMEGFRRGEETLCAMCNVEEEVKKENIITRKEMH